MLEIEKIKTNLLFLLFLKDHTISIKLTILKNELIFYITNNIKHLLFSTIYMSALFLRKLNILH